MINGYVKKDNLDYLDNYNETTIIRQLTMEEILTRDQRTTSHRVIDPHFYQERVDNPSPSTTPSNSPPTHSRIGDIRFGNPIDKPSQLSNPLITTGTTNSGLDNRFSSSHLPNSYNKRIRGYVAYQGSSTATWLRLGSLLVTLLVASINGAPTMTPEDRRLNSQRKWVNPCGLSAMDVESELDIVRLKDDQLLSQVVIQARTALLHAEVFRDDYIKQTFNTDLADLHSLWKDNHYSWLPSTEEIPKELGGKLPEEFLKELELDKTLLDAYEYMQKYAVGLEQIVWDQEDHNNEFREQFTRTQYKLRTVLCELQVAIVERGVTPRPDVERSVMLPEYRDIWKSGETFLNLRDWLIFRDYMNGLEYIIQVFEHLRKSLDS